jgi:hypothetical protein
MEGVFLPHVLDAEVVNDESNGYGAGRMIPPGCQVLLQAFVGYDTSLGKSIHPLPDFDEDFFVCHESSKLIFLHDIRWNVTSRDQQLLVTTFQRIIQVKIFYVKCREVGIWG